MSAGLQPEDLPHYSVEDYVQWSGDWELIHGIPYAMSPAPTKLHQKLTLAIGNQLLSESAECPDCEVLLETDWVIRADTLLRPDVAVVCGDDNPRHIAKTPDIVCEVLSPSTARRDEGLKLREYEEAGVRYYVLIDPEQLMARVFQHSGKGFQGPAECTREHFRFEKSRCPLSLDFDALFRPFR
ncbi:Uma2 family endonuclease [Thiorhodococcus minor]|uniref:Uma2 family endonuclease n=1 Tax=Thiorhodococcus minor TaxID=57489 RepID=A0A6M0JVL5_9GAMM|nr:Uma2 family endonuclease [Thiorhodococcus minor]NEV61094.1 Uma2 family endonuclease [Thiorhodococcus minor]